MKKSIFLNKNEKVSFYWVDVEIGRRAGDFLYTLYDAIGLVLPVVKSRATCTRLIFDAQAPIDGPLPSLPSLFFSLASLTLTDGRVWMDQLDHHWFFSL
jgi:hypothetical protein